MSEIKAIDIIKAWGNYIFPDAEIEKVAKERAEVCSACDYARPSRVLNVFIKDKNQKVQGYKCTACPGCPISAKTRDMSRGKDGCPKGYWER